MEQRRWLRAVRIVAALSVLAAIGYQMYSLREMGVFRPANFFSFFTIQSNILSVIVLLTGGLLLTPASSGHRWDFFRGAVVLYMSVTGVVYGLLLTGYQEALQTHVPWVDTILHRIIPIVMVVDWLIDPPGRPIRYRQGLLWVLFPAAYLVYSLVRGPIANWYPYPFLDPDVAGGYGGVLAYCVAISIGIAGFVWLVTSVGGRWRLATDNSPRQDDVH